jgi:hypothetical protein
MRYRNASKKRTDGGALLFTVSTSEKTQIARRAILRSWRLPAMLAATTQINVVLNWTEELKHIVSAGTK